MSALEAPVIVAVAAVISPIIAVIGTIQSLFMIAQLAGGIYSTAIGTKIINPGNGKNISQVQVSSGGGRDGKNPYVKFSTTDQGIIKVVDGYEKAILIFTKQ